VSNVAGFVQPGHRVDIQATTTLNTGEGGKPYTQLVLQNIEVLAAGADTAPSTDAPVKPANTVTLRLTRDQANLLGSYQSGGATLQLLLRAVNDKEIYTTVGKLQGGVSRELVSTNAPDDLLPAATGSPIMPPPIAPISDPIRNPETKPDSGVADNKTPEPPPSRIPSIHKNDFVMTIIDDPTSETPTKRKVFKLEEERQGNRGQK
jgi:Flp pilus assembly protein CpaB